MKTIKISGLWVIVIIALLAVAWSFWHNRDKTDPLLHAQNSQLITLNKDKNNQIIALNNDLKALRQELYAWQYKDSIMARNVLKRDIIIKKLHDKLGAIDSIKNWNKDSTLNFIVGTYAVPLDTLYLMGANIPWLIAEDITKSNLLDSIVPELDKQIVELKALTVLKGKVITNLTGQVANRDSVVATQMKQIALKNELVAAQEKKIRGLKTQRIALIAGSVIIVIAAL